MADIKHLVLLPADIPGHKDQFVSLGHKPETSLQIGQRVMVDPVHGTIAEVESIEKVMLVRVKRVYKAQVM